MRLSRLWKRDKKNRYISVFQKLFDVKLVLLSIFSLIILSSCNEKAPELMINRLPLSFDYITICSDFIDDTTRTTTPSLGASKLLISGENESISSYCLIKFENFSQIPESLSVDSILNFVLRLQSSSDSLSAPETEVALSLLKSDCNVANWSEDSSNCENFSIDDLTAELIESFTYQNSDTFEIKLPDSLLIYWMDTSVVNYGLAIQQVETGVNSIQTFYSRENSESSPLINIKYVAGGDTISTNIYPTADVSIIKFADIYNDGSHILISKGKAFIPFVYFNLSSIDKNSVIGEGLLHMKIDTTLTKMYDRDFTIYMNLLDSSDWGNPLYTPQSGDIQSIHTVHSGDTAVALKIDQTVQMFTSGTRKNFGVVIWPSPYNFDLSVLHIFSSSSSDSTKRPYLEILLMKEE